MSEGRGLMLGSPRTLSERCGDEEGEAEEESSSPGSEGLDVSSLVILHHQAK